jgi:hypothetical protein
LLSVLANYANHSAAVHEGLRCTAEGSVLLFAVQSEKYLGDFCHCSGVSNKKKKIGRSAATF